MLKSLVGVAADYTVGRQNCSPSADRVSLSLFLSGKLGILFFRAEIGGDKKKRSILSVSK